MRRFMLMRTMTKRTIRRGRRIGTSIWGGRVLLSHTAMRRVDLSQTLCGPVGLGYTRTVPRRAWIYRALRSVSAVRAQQVASNS
jgi:hypothetical protein